MKKYVVPRMLVVFFVPIIIITLSVCSRVSDTSAIIKGPYLQNVKTDGITIMWETKNPATGKVVFGKSRSLGNEVFETDLKITYRFCYFLHILCVHANLTLNLYTCPKI